MAPSSEKRNMDHESVPLLNGVPSNGSIIDNNNKQELVVVTYGTDPVDSPNVFSSSRRLKLVASFHRGLSNFITHHTGSIGWLGSISIAVNSLTGPAMLNLPSTFQKSGLIPTLATLFFVCVLSALCSLHMANTISKVPGNDNFQRHIEYSEVFRRFWGDRWFAFTQVAFFGCVTCLNISSIVDTAQVTDTFLGHWMPGGGSVAIQFTGVSPPSVNIVRWTYNDCEPSHFINGKCNPFSHRKEGVLLTLGYILTTMAFFPLALMDLKENTLCQVVGFIVLLVISLQFIVAFATSELFSLDNLSLWGDSWGSLFGVILFNFCLVIAIPAWLYEKEPHVPVPAVIHHSFALSTLLYVLIGVLGACSFPHVAENMLETMLSGVMGNSMQLGASLFAFAIVGLGVPLFSVFTRLNLTGSGTYSVRVANLLAVYLPFGVSWMLYHKVTQLLTWGGIIFTSLVAFLLPLLLAWHTDQVCDSRGSIAIVGGGGSTTVDSADSRRIRTIAIVILFVLAVISVVAAILGLIFGG